MRENDLHIKNAKKHKAKAVTITVLAHAGVLLLCIFLIAFTIEDPPPGEQFVAVEFADLGNVAQASGDVETEVPSEVVEEVVEEAESAEVVEEVVESEPVETQEVSDIVIPEQEEVEEVEEVVEEEPVRTSEGAGLVASNAASGGGSEGTQEAGVGNEGEENGKIEGMGVVTKDFGAGLKGGEILTYPVITGDPKNSGSIRVKIYVDSEGNVTNPEIDYSHKETTLRDGHSIALALKSAKTAKFKFDTPIQPHQKRPGHITFFFKLE